MYPFYGIYFLIAIYILAPVSLVLTLMGLYNIMTMKIKDSTLRLTWVIILIFVPLIGILYYLFIGIKQIRENSSML